MICSSVYFTWAHLCCRIGNTGTGVQQPQEVVYLVMVPTVDLGFFPVVFVQWQLRDSDRWSYPHPAVPYCPKTDGIGRKCFHIPALTFGINGIKSKRRLPLPLNPVITVRRLRVWSHRCFSGYAPSHRTHWLRLFSRAFVWFCLCQFLVPDRRRFTLEITWFPVHLIRE